VPFLGGLDGDDPADVEAEGKNVLTVRAAEDQASVVACALERAGDDAVERAELVARPFSRLVEIEIAVLLGLEPRHHLLGREVVAVEDATAANIIGDLQSDAVMDHPPRLAHRPGEQQ
jgi:hypothetical protein